MEYNVIFDPSSYKQTMNFVSVACFKIAIVNIIGGLMFGYQIGFVGVYNTYNSINSNCSALTTEAACGSVHFADCVWGSFANVSGAHGNASACYFSDVKSGYLCGAYNGDQSACGDHSACIYNHDSNTCEHALGWTPPELGVFAAAMIIGGMIGSFGVAPILRIFGRKKTLLLIGVVATVSSGLMHVASRVDSYPLFVAARILIGVAGGMTCVACPLYVDEMAPEDLKGQIGVLFQVFLTLGIMIAAAVGYGLEPRDFSVDLQMRMRMQVVIGVSSALCALVIPMSLLIAESRKWVSGGMQGEDAELQGPSYLDDDDADKSSFTGNIGPLLVAVALSIAQQLTGINAIMNYAPNITASVGLTPLLGNLIVMAWNFVTTLVSIPVAKRFSTRQMYLTGAFIASGACLMTGVPVFPGVVADDKTRHIVAGVGIIIFIAAFEIGMGPAFYMLAQQLFPRTFRSKGSSFTIVVQFVFNIIINVCFPIAVTGLSGGPAGNQNRGMGIVFMFFGCAGLTSWFVLVKFLHPAEKPSTSSGNGVTLKS